MMVKEESEKAGLKFNIQKIRIMASRSHHFTANSRGKSRSSDSKITADGECSHSYEIKICLLLGRKAMTNSILKSRDITLPTKVHIVKTMVFPVVMYRCESWLIKNAEHQREASKL